MHIDVLRLFHVWVNLSVSRKDIWTFCVLRTCSRCMNGCGSVGRNAISGSPVTAHSDKQWIRRNVGRRTFGHISQKCLHQNSEKMTTEPWLPIREMLPFSCARLPSVPEATVTPSFGENEMLRVGAQHVLSNGGWGKFPRYARSKVHCFQAYSAKL